LCDVKIYLSIAVPENGLCVVYHSLENARVYHAEPPQKLEFPLECYGVIEYALNSWPKYVKVGDAPGIEDDEELLEVVVALYDAGLLMRKL
jgi:lysine-specific demethylase/histidyl-hydroxylase NO66